MYWNRILPVIPETRLALADAYTRVFRTGGASQEDRDAVLNDIMTFSGYFDVNLEPNFMAINEGKRSVGGLIFSMTFMPDAEREALYQASRQTRLEEQRYG